MSDSNSMSSKDGSSKQDVTSDAPMPEVARVNNSAPFQWLKLGWLDFKATRFLGLFYGGLFVLMGYAIVWIYATQWQLTMGLVGGFFLIGPFLCTGIYDLSRQREQGEPISLWRSLVCWKRNLGVFALFTLILTFAMVVWARISVIIFALSSSTSFPTLQGVLKMIFSFDNLAFLLIWSGVGFIFASFVFAIGVISAPMILDRGSDTLEAVFTSVRCVITNPIPLYLWAFLVVSIIGGSILLGFLPLLVTAPLIGHGTWHAYKSLVK